MRIVVLGKGSEGSGLADLWRAAGHEVTTLGRQGGDASGADVVVVAVPYHSVTEALGNVSGLAGQVTVDVCNVNGPRTGSFDSIAAEVKSIIGGPTAKAFTNVFAATFGEVAAQRFKPSVLVAADDDARAPVEELIGDAGFEPVFIGALDPGARLIEDGFDLWVAIVKSVGLYFPRYAVPGQL
jgi:8-hydroxy-5-deazaflavin:NADPH oxidoreductase